jgi:hypothetical protein
MAMKAVSVLQSDAMASLHLPLLFKTPLKHDLVISATVDMRNIKAAIKELNKYDHDPMHSANHMKIVARASAHESPREEPDISPLLATLMFMMRAELTAHGMVETSDVLAPGAILFRRKVEEVGFGEEYLD